MELTPRQKKICDLVDMIDSSMNWSLSEDEKDKKIIVYSIGLEGIPDELIDAGLERQLRLNAKEFPTPGQFRALCNPVKKPELKLLTFEDSIRDNELNKKESRSILQQLGVKLSEQGHVEKVRDSRKKLDKQIGVITQLVRTIKKNKG